MQLASYSKTLPPPYAAETVQVEKGATGWLGPLCFVTELQAIECKREWTTWADIRKHFTVLCNWLRSRGDLSSMNGKARPCVPWKSRLHGKHNSSIIAVRASHSFLRQHECFSTIELSDAKTFWAEYFLSHTCHVCFHRCLSSFFGHASCLRLSTL